MVPSRVSCFTHWIMTCPAPPGSSVIQSVTCMKHSSSAKLGILWTYILGREWWLNFLTVEGSSLIEISRRLRSVCGEVAIDVSSVGRWVHHFKSGEKDIGDRPHNGWPATAAMMETKDKVDALIRDDHRITTSELWASVGIGNMVIMAKIKELGYRKICASWVPKMLTVEHKTGHKEHLSTTSPVQWKRGRCFSVKNNYRRWNPGSSLLPIDEKTVSGMASSVVTTQKKNSRCG